MFAALLILGFVEYPFFPVAKVVSSDMSAAHQSRRYERIPRILFLEQKGCLPCVALKRELEPEFAALRAVGWKIGSTSDCHVQIVDIGEQPHYAVFAVNGTPAIVRFDGWGLVAESATRPMDRWSIGLLLKGVDERPQPEPRPFYATRPSGMVREKSYYCPTCRR